MFKIQTLNQIDSEGLSLFPLSKYEIASEIYDTLDGYSELLKLEQTGARVEYLNQRGLVTIDNLKDLEHEHTPVLRYRCV